METSKIFRTSLSIASWNIQCISNDEGLKTHNDEFLNIVRDKDIICLQETKDAVELPNYRSYSNLRKKVKRASGGVVTLINNQLKNAVEIVKDSSSLSPDILVIKLKHSYINTVNDIFIINTYIRPYNSKLRFTKIVIF